MTKRLSCPHTATAGATSGMRRWAVTQQRGGLWVMIMWRRGGNLPAGHEGPYCSECAGQRVQYLNSLHDKITVTPGTILVASIDVLLSTETFLLLDGDLHSKYADLSWGGGADNLPSVYLFASSRTLKTGPGTEMTRIDLPARTKGWHIMAETARYSLRIAAWNPERVHRTEIWSDQS